MTVPVLRSETDILAAAASFAAAIAPGASERDRAGVHPVSVLDAFDQTGLNGILVPAVLGGAGASLATVGEVMRILAVADASVAQSVQPHFVVLKAILLCGTPEQQAFFADAVLRGQRMGNALSERGTRTSMDFKTRIARAPDGTLRLNGRKFYCTGSLSAAWVPVYALDEAHRLVIAYLERDTPGLELVDDWTGMGQRGTASGTLTATDVVVAEDRVLPLYEVINGAQIWNAFARYLHAAIDVGLAESALTEASRFVRERSRPWFEAGVERAAEEPLVIQAFGRLAAEVSAAAALLRRAGRFLDDAQSALEQSSATRAAAAVAEAKAFAGDIAVQAADELFALAGTSATDERHNLSRLWRDARTHSIHDPNRWSYHSAGYFAVHGDLPRSGAHGGVSAHRKDLTR